MKHKPSLSLLLLGFTINTFPRNHPPSWDELDLRPKSKTSLRKYPPSLNLRPLTPLASSVLAWLSWRKPFLERQVHLLRHLRNFLLHRQHLRNSCSQRHASGSRLVWSVPHNITANIDGGLLQNRTSIWVGRPGGSTSNREKFPFY